MLVTPTNISSPVAWNAIVTHGGASDGFAIQWTAPSPAQDLAAGQSLSGFSFESIATPAQIGSFASLSPATPVETSLVYGGQPFSDAGFELVASNINTSCAGPFDHQSGCNRGGLCFDQRGR
jgi:hypothetical protein